MAGVEGRTSATNNDPHRTNNLDATREPDCFAAGSSIICNGTIEGRPVDMLVDTGSVFTLISKVLWDTICEDISHSRYTCAAGSSTGR